MGKYNFASSQDQEKKHISKAVKSINSVFSEQHNNPYKCLNRT